MSEKQPSVLFAFSIVQHRFCFSLAMDVVRSVCPRLPCRPSLVFSGVPEDLFSSSTAPEGVQRSFLHRPSFSAPDSDT